MNSIARSTLPPKALARKFNQRFPIGTRVRYWIGRREGSGQVSATRTEAQVLGGHTAVVWVEGRSECFALSHVEPLPPEAGAA
jgi:hypothetical protein